MARPGRLERLWPGGNQLHETPHRGAYGNDHFGRHASRLVGSLRVGSVPADWLCLARLPIHARSAEWASPHRLRAPPANHLGQGTDGPHQNAVLVSTRAMLVRPEEEGAGVWKGRGGVEIG